MLLRTQISSGTIPNRVLSSLKAMTTTATDTLDLAFGLSVFTIVHAESHQIPHLNAYRFLRNLKVRDHCVSFNIHRRCSQNPRGFFLSFPPSPHRPLHPNYQLFHSPSSPLPPYPHPTLLYSPQAYPSQQPSRTHYSS
jgi:hypothetical protein